MIVYLDVCVVNTSGRLCVYYVLKSVSAKCPDLRFLMEPSPCGCHRIARSSKATSLELKSSLSHHHPFCSHQFCLDFCSCCWDVDIVITLHEVCASLGTFFGTQDFSLVEIACSDVIAGCCTCFPPLPCWTGHGVTVMSFEWLAKVGSKEIVFDADCPFLCCCICGLVERMPHTCLHSSDVWALSGGVAG